jgi:hypothetical protein
MKAALFLHGKDISVLIPFIPDIIHEVFNQMDSETTGCAIFNVILQSRLLGFKRIKRLAVILNADIQDALCGCNRYFYKMIGMLVKAVG